MKAGISHLSSPNRKTSISRPYPFCHPNIPETRAVRRPRSPGGQIGAGIQQGRQETKPKTPKLGEVQRPRVRTRTRSNPKETDHVLEVKRSTQGWQNPLCGVIWGSNCAALPGTQQDWGLNQHLPQAINSDQLLSCAGEGGAGDVC